MGWLPLTDQVFELIASSGMVDTMGHLNMGGNISPITFLIRFSFTEYCQMLHPKWRTDQTNQSVLRNLMIYGRKTCVRVQPIPQRIARVYIVTAGKIPILRSNCVCGAVPPISFIG